MSRVAFPLVLQSPVTGSAIVGAKATITKHVPGVTLGSGEAAEVFTSETENISHSNVLTSDSTGRWTQGEGAGFLQYWLPEGSYDIAISGTGITTVVITRELVGGSPTAGLVAGTGELVSSGVTSNSDWNNGGTINSGTGAISTGGAWGGVAWIGVPPVRTITPNVKMPETVPPSLPASGKYMVVGVELSAPNGPNAPAAINLVSGAEFATQAEAEALSASPALTAKHLRIKDLIILNTAGVYSIARSNDRRASAPPLRTYPNAGGPVSPLFVSSGFVNPSAELSLNGTGDFTSVHLGTGEYEVKWRTEHKSYRAFIMPFQGLGGHRPLIPEVASREAFRMLVNIYDKTFTLTDSGFDFFTLGT